MGTNPAVFRRTMAGLREVGLVRSGKGHGGGWQLARPLSKISLLMIYDALGRPNLFAIGGRNSHSDCQIEKNVNTAMAKSMARAEAILMEGFGNLTLNLLLPKKSDPVSVHGRN